MSVGIAGEDPDFSSGFPSISADGRFVAFSSFATNLVPGDTNEGYDAFVHDRETGETRRVSVSSSGVEGNRPSHLGAISADGRFVAFDSRATSLISGDTNRRSDIFVRGPLR